MTHLICSDDDDDFDDEEAEEKAPVKKVSRIQWYEVVRNN